MSQQTDEPTDAWTQWLRSMEQSWFRFPRGAEAPSARQWDQMHVDFWEEATRQGLRAMRHYVSMVDQGAGGTGGASRAVEDMINGWLVGQETFWANWFLARRQLDLDWSNPEEAMAKLGELCRETARRAAQAQADALAGT